jgi:hypothetical protein
MSTTDPLPSPQLATPTYDQVVKGNVIIKKISKHMYRITFRKIGKFLVYQVWDKDNAGNNNNKRLVYYMFAKTWVELFRQIQESNNKNNELVFTPTTIMETEDYKKYAFVIKKAYMNSNSNAVFTVSTKEISLKNNTSKKLIKLPCRKFNNVRFDIDYPSKDNNNVEYHVSDCGYGGIRMYCCGGRGSGSACGYWLDGNIRNNIWETYPKAIYPKYQKAPLQDSGPPPVDYNWDASDFDSYWTQQQIDDGTAANAYKDK